MLSNLKTEMMQILILKLVPGPELGVVGGAGVVVDLWGFCLRRGRGGGAGRTPTKLFGFFADFSLG